MNAAIVFNNFSFAYQARCQALTNIRFTIPAGTFAVLAGLNGAGKTSLCYAVSGLIPHYFGGAITGSVTVAGVDTLKTEVSALAEKVGTVLEDYESQLVTMTVEEEVAFSLENRGVSRESMKPLISETLRLVGLAGLEQREVASLSGGQKQRLAIAAAIAPQPSILVLDEPTSALDPEGAEELYTLLARLNRGTKMTVLVVEHDLARVLPFADQLIVLEAGQQVAVGTPAGVLATLSRSGCCPELLPPLTRLKRKLENGSGVAFGEWLKPEAAIAEISHYLKAGGAKIA